MYRLLALGAAVLATALFVAVRNWRDLEDSAFVGALLACSALALALSATLAAFAGPGPRPALLVGLAAFLLVPLLYVAYLVIYAVIVCGILGETCYS